MGGHGRPRRPGRRRGHRAGAGHGEGGGIWCHGARAVPARARPWPAAPSCRPTTRSTATSRGRRSIRARWPTCARSASRPPACRLRLELPRHPVRGGAGGPAARAGRFTAYGYQSDPGPYPIPPDAAVEQGTGDRHVVVLQQGSCRLYELFGAHRGATGWSAASGARFDLRSNALRPAGWTSADAAGLPILPGLARAGEVPPGRSRTRCGSRAAHATRLRRARAPLATRDPTAPAADGARLRLKASFRPVAVSWPGPRDPAWR